MMLNIKTRKELWLESTLEENQNCDYCSPLPVRYFDSSVENEVWVSQESLKEKLEIFMSTLEHELKEDDILCVEFNKILEELKGEKE